MSSIVLVGFMGVGKTVVGKMLAEELKMKFVDLDELIEEKRGMSIGEIFEQFGEYSFRKVEREIVSEISKGNNLVVAAGGGAVLDSQNVRNLRNMGTMIHLSARPDVILKRTGNEYHRPLLECGDRAKRIQRLLEERRPFYARADCEIDTSDLRIEDVVERIINCLRESSDGTG